jgi:hypothetical protein
MLEGEKKEPIPFYRNRSLTSRRSVRSRQANTGFGTLRGCDLRVAEELNNSSEEFDPGSD